jgi:TonB-linked SusC/RagA family outer membrane protein
MYKIFKINSYSFIVKTLLLGAFTLLLAASMPLFSQTSGGISGKVSSADFPEGLPGVSVLVKGSGLGTSTINDGSYAIGTLPKDATLIFSFIGFITQEIPVNGRTIINVELIENANALDEIVVTGLSLARDKNSLGYSITQVNNESLTNVKLNNPINSLAGRVAGLQISATPSGVDGSTRVVLRGVSSLTGNNRPLVVIDGIPVNSNSFGNAGVGGGKDMGDALSDINRNDVETMTILKGAGAAAIYGSRGANGVILVTTKKGSKTKGTGIALSSSYIIDQPFLFPKLQNTYGQGAFGTYPSNLASIEEPWLWSWGPKMEGQELTNWLGKSSSFSEQPNPLSLFYTNGYSAINTVSFDGGGEKSSVRASFTNQAGQGIISTNKISKQTLNLRGSSKLGKFFELDGKITYIYAKGKDRPYLAEDNANAGWALSTLPRNVPLSELRENIVNKNKQELWAWDKTLGNPYWAQEYKRNQDEKNRMQSLFSLKTVFSEKMNMMFRSGFDFLNRNTKEYAALGSAVNSNFRGTMNQSFNNEIEWNTDFLANYNTNLSDKIGVGFSAGGNYRYNKSNGISQSGNGWRVPDFYNISNLQNFNTSEGFSEKEVVSLYSLGNISYSDFLYMDFSYRSDWSSTLPAGSNRYPFYSLNGSFLFHDLLKINNSILSKGQLRASYAVTGNDTSPYQTENYYSVGQSALPYPIGNLNSRLAFANFKPEIKTSWEIGTNLGFWGGRINLDMDYYTTVTDNQIMSVSLAPSSGFNSINQNAGSVKNQGIEALLSATVIESKSGLNWDISFNATKNKSKVLSLADNQDRIVLQTSILNLATIEVRPGDPFGSIYGYDYARDAEGNKIISAGFPIKPSANDYKRLGDINPRLTGGMSNKLDYKNFGLNFLVDFQLGGSFYSHGQLYRELMGTAENTLEGREEWYATHGGSGFLENKPGVIPKGFVEQGKVENGGGVNDVPVDPMLRNLQVIWFNRTVKDYILDASNVRMREVSLSYNLPEKWLKKTPITKVDISLVGRNLFFFYNAAINMDPESGYSSSSIGNAFELNAMPSARSIGVNLNVSF